MRIGLVDVDGIHKKKKWGGTVHPMKRVHEFPQWQKDLTHWVNNRALFNTMHFPDFEPRKGFKCGWYLEQYAYKPKV